MTVYLLLQNRLIAHLRTFLKQKYNIDLTNIVVEQPPKIEFGEFALPVSFELARALRKAPRKIADEIVAEIPLLEGFAKFEVAGAGYINARLDRTRAAQLVAGGDGDDEVAAPMAFGATDGEETGSAVNAALSEVRTAGAAAAAAPAPARGKVMVEHTSINPNKAAHIGHLRNSILGDTLVRLLRAAGYAVDVQNYIDNTGVQVADVVVGFERIAQKSKAEIAELIADPEGRFDYYCWDLYAKVSLWYEEDKERLQARRETLHLLEAGGNETAEIAQMISMEVLRRHLETMQRLDIEYDFLPQESDILHLQFWAKAFELLKQKGVLYFEEEGKNKGCWVMTRPGRVKGDGAKLGASQAGTREMPPLPPHAPDEDAKVIVRSNGTVGYVGKDIAYHMWKFGLLGLDFGYRKFYEYSDGRPVWISCDPKENAAAQSQAEHPHFGGVGAIYNVIDARQSDPQETVKQAILLMGHEAEAARYTHFSYEMVALTPRCAMELGYAVSEEDQQRSYIEVSGRKGFGVKADDLLDKLIEAAKSEVDSRHGELSEDERRQIATQIAIGALRYFMLKFTKQSVIAFDFREALSFEGETGPYVQYAVVRATNIFRKAGSTPEEALQIKMASDAFEGNDDLWSLWLMAGQTAKVIEQCIATAEPAAMTKHSFQLAQQFNNFYHKHHILTEGNAGRKALLLATAAVVRRELIATMAVMGIPVPAVM